MKNILSSFILILLIYSNLNSQEIPYGWEFQVNTYTYLNQEEPAITKLKDGGFVICWHSHLESGIFAQIFDSSGLKKGDEFQVNTNRRDGDNVPAMASLADGRFIVSWQSYQISGNAYYIINGQIFDNSGAKLGPEFRINTTLADWQLNPKVTGLSNNGFVVCWNMRDDAASRGATYGQIFDANANMLGSVFQINTLIESTNTWRCGVSALLDGGFIVCWDSLSITGDSYDDDVYCQLFTDSGAPKGKKVQVNTTTTGQQGMPAIATLSDGRFIVCWASDEKSDFNAEVFCQVLDRTGAKIGSEFQANTFTNGYQGSPAVVSLSNGGFFVCWMDDIQDGSEYGIYGQLYDASSNKIGQEFRVNSYTKGGQYSPAATGLENRGFVITWTSGLNQDGDWTGIFAKRFPNEPQIHRLEKFSLLDPLNDVTIDSTSVSFHWQQPSNMSEIFPWEISFDLYIDKDYNFTNPQIIRGIQDTTYTIDSLVAGKTYFWKVLTKNLAGDSLYSTQQDWGFFIKQGATLIEKTDNELPRDFELFQNYPNPFNSSTEIKYSLPNVKASYKVQLKIYDVLGRLVKVLVNQEQSAGTYSVGWDGTDLNGNRIASGVYFYSLVTEEFKSVRKMVVLQ